MPNETAPISLDESFWNELLLYLKEGKVIPIIGAELFAVTVEGAETTVEKIVAQKLAEEFNLPGRTRSPEATLHEVVTRLQKKKDFRRESVYPHIQMILKRTALPMPESLRQLADIDALRLFVTTTFDTLLEQALNEKRFQGQNQTRSLAYAPSNVDDIDFDKNAQAPTTVFHLFGRVCSSPDYVVTEEDLLEFVMGLQKGKRPQRLFDLLKDHHLLFLGSNFPDWLSRFFLRTTIHTKLSQQRDRSEILVDRNLRGDRKLVQFLSNYSYRTGMVLDCDPAQFVAELHRRWRAEEPEPSAAASITVENSEPQMPAGAIFISYASGNVAFAQLVHDGLKAAGLDVWFDKRELELGDAYNAKIKQNIERCSFFVPLISALTEQRLSGYFRKEWNLAAERCLEYDESQAFVLPVAIGAGAPLAPDSHVPEAFKKVQWYFAGEAAPGADFVQKLVQLTRARRKQSQVGL